MSGEFAAAAVVLSVASLVYAQQTGVLALAVREADYSTDVYGWLLTLNAVVVILVEVPLSRYTGRWQRRTPLILGTVFVCAGYAVNLAGISLPVLIIGVLSWTLGEVLMTPVAAAFATEAAPPSQESVYLSFLSMCQTVGYAVGPAAGVYAYGQHAALPWLMCSQASWWSVRPLCTTCSPGPVAGSDLRGLSSGLYRSRLRRRGRSSARAPGLNSTYTAESPGGALCTRRQHTCVRTDGTSSSSHS